MSRREKSMDGERRERRKEKQREGERGAPVSGSASRIR